jgi:DNA polymerase III gamma/tau subunit
VELYKKYRPATLDEMVGNEDVVCALKNMLSKDEAPHTYLFHGPSGCGKTTLARILSKELGCAEADYREVDTADFRGIDTAREIRKQIRYAPLEGSCKVWLLDECHKMTNDAQNGLLKALEDTPAHVYFILATTEPEKLLKTIRGRCSQFQVDILDDAQMFKLLRHVVKSEGAKLSKNIYEQIIEDSLGHCRDALQILEQVLNADPDKRLAIAKRAAELQSQTIELCRALMGNAPWKKVASILQGLKTQDPESIRRAVLGYCNAVLLKGTNNQAAIIMEEFIEPFYNTGFPGLTFACYSIVNGE